MIVSIRSFVLALVVFGFSLSATDSYSMPTGKIYLAGKWVDAQRSSTPPSSFSPLFNPFFFQGEPENNKNEVLKFLAGNSLLVGGKFDGTSWNDVSVQSGPELETHRVTKLWNGLEVLGGEAVVHLQEGKIAFANADNTNLNHLSATPNLRDSDAEIIAFSSYRGRALRTSAPELKVIILGQGDSREGRLVYAVKVVDIDMLSSDVHFIDAQNGQETLVTTNVHTASANRKVMAGTGSRDDLGIVSDSNAEQLIDQKFKTIYSDTGCDATGGFSFWENWKRRQEAPVTAGMRECNTLAPEVMSSASAAWNNSGKVLAYYQNAHRWNSVNGSGAPIRSVVNFGGPTFFNAAWYNERRIMLYGMGDGQRYNDFASSLDIVGHEITHGITMSTSKLAYASESGALNESFSDVFGKLISLRSGGRNDWKIGRELFMDGVNFVRDMENPTIGHNRDFKFRGSACTRFNDFCGVHDNAGIPNKAAVMIAKSLGLEKLGKLYFLTLTQLLRSGSDFREARAQTEAACATLFRNSPSDCVAVSEAFNAVGI